MEVRSKKIAELNQYKDANAEKKYNDIQNLLKMMNTHGKLPKDAGSKKDGTDSQAKMTWLAQL